MPIYEYRCGSCGQLFEEWTRQVDDGTGERSCPLCRGKARRIISNTSFALKGGGWYVTEYGTHKDRCRKEEGGCAAAGAEAGSGGAPCAEAGSGKPTCSEAGTCPAAKAGSGTADASGRKAVASEQKAAPTRKEAPAAP
ncbi:MAG: zinc ribbon domain-containing protein [Desulfovibrio sp.]|nr:zinc ribbon domain-containing protein [Desulfovibrio sp.]